MVDDADEDFVLSQDIRDVEISRCRFASFDLRQPRRLGAICPVIKGGLESLQFITLNRIFENQVALFFPLLALHFCRSNDSSTSCAAVRRLTDLSWIPNVSAENRVLSGYLPDDFSRFIDR